LSKIQALTVAKNKEKLKSIVETIIFCGRQGIALLSHHDDHTCLGDVPHANLGNLNALLNFRIESGDTVLEDHLKSCGGNAFYISKTIQNQLIAVCGKIIQLSILQEIRTVSLFSIMVDEVTDASNKEQLALCIRYINSSTLKIEERFWGLANVKLVFLDRQLLLTFFNFWKHGSFLLLSYVAKHMMVLVQWQERLKEQLQESLSCIQKHYTQIVHLMFLTCAL